MNLELQHPDFIEQVSHFCKGLNVCSGATPACPSCNLDEDEEYCDEGHFSWSSCDSCGSTLGGTRFIAHGTCRDEDGKFQLIHLDICVDCLMYHEYGTLPGEEI